MPVQHNATRFDAVGNDFSRDRRNEAKLYNAQPASRWYNLVAINISTDRQEAQYYRTKPARQIKSNQDAGLNLIIFAG